MKLALLWGRLKSLWILVKPLLLSRVGDFLLDPRVRALAVRAVERAAGIDLDGDGKHDHAVREMAAELRSLGIEYYRAWLSIAVEAAYRLIKN